MPVAAGPSKCLLGIVVLRAGSGGVEGIETEAEAAINAAAVTRP